MTDEVPMSSSTREKILAAIHASPGIHVRGVAQVLQLGWTTVNHHVVKLDKEGRILKMEHEGKQILFPNTVPAAARPVLYVLREGNAMDLLQIIATRPGMQLKEITKRYGCSRKITSRSLKRFIETGLVERHGGHRGTYHLTPEGRTWVGGQETNGETAE